MKHKTENSNGRAVWSIALKMLWRRRLVSLLLLGVALIGVFSSLALHSLTRRQEDALKIAIEQTLIHCVMTDVRGLNSDNLNVPSSFADIFSGMRGNEFDPKKNLSPLVKNVRAKATFPLTSPSDTFMCRVLTFDSDSRLNSIDGYAIEYADGYDESVLKTQERVCFIPRDMQGMQIGDDGREYFSVLSETGESFLLKVAGRVGNGSNNVIYVPFNMSSDDNVLSEAFFMDSCSFDVCDSLIPEQTLSKKKELFFSNPYIVEPNIKNEPQNLSVGILVQDASYLEMRSEMESNLKLLTFLLPLLILIMGCIGFFASFLTTRGRVTEFAVMRSMGMKRIRLFALVFCEQAIPAFAGGIIGFAGGLMLNEGSGISALIKACVILMIFLLGSAVAVMQLTSINTMELLRLEE